MGIYDVTAEQAGFKKFIRSGITVEVGQTARVDIGMQIGEVSQTVEMQARLLFCDPTLPTWEPLSPVRRSLDLPLTGQGEQRNPAFFMILVPGVTGRGTSYGGGAYV